jgi:hypothetical protein
VLATDDLVRLEALLHDNDLAAAEEVARLAPALRQALGEAGYVQLQVELDSLDFAAAEQRLLALTQTVG